MAWLPQPASAQTDDDTFVLSWWRCRMPCPAHRHEFLQKGRRGCGGTDEWWGKLWWCCKIINYFMFYHCHHRKYWFSRKQTQINKERKKRWKKRPKIFKQRNPRVKIIICYTFTLTVIISACLSRYKNWITFVALINKTLYNYQWLWVKKTSSVRQNKENLH